MYPNLLLLQSPIARSLLQYRIARIPQALDRATSYGWQGAPATNTHIPPSSLTCMCHPSRGYVSMGERLYWGRLCAISRPRGAL